MTRPIMVVFRLSGFNQNTIHLLHKGLAFTKYWTSLFVGRIWVLNSECQRVLFCALCPSLAAHTPHQTGMNVITTLIGGMKLSDERNFRVVLDHSTLLILLQVSAKWPRSICRVRICVFFVPHL